MGYAHLIVACPRCAAETRPGQKFCAECGLVLSGACPNCGTPYEGSPKFCAECGNSLAAPEAGVAPDAAAQHGASGQQTPATERRYVSVLFADLVGFTTLSEQEDPEEVRELLSRYFDAARAVIDGYGGIVEKFIGDAVMAVWGAPVAQEDDPERAVRAALGLVDRVRELTLHGSPLAVRAGVMTGEAAVTPGRVQQGMVAGDIVNTASRLQSVAPPGVVLVGEQTFRATSAAIAYEPAGEQLLKGKSAPVDAWRALRVVARIGGEARNVGLEAPFVGRDEELRLLQGTAPRGGARAEAARRGRDRPGRDGQEPAGVGTGEVPRRPRRAAALLLAPGPISVVWRGRYLLGTGRDGSTQGAHRGG